ncbi:hypothetical protein FGO68_gene2153 [Halteria grandinella]|uniref:Uncharacterized protein n=1 Tax=Halteria grandinella TaxID=5974 RepID=A0A8J8NZ11_HALGN|nr:hypothetical protein FGO68_gene2153 [Halteria grandinella]
MKAQQKLLLKSQLVSSSSSIFLGADQTTTASTLITPHKLQFSVHQKDLAGFRQGKNWRGAVNENKYSVLGVLITLIPQRGTESQEDAEKIRILFGKKFSKQEVYKGSIDVQAGMVYKIQAQVILRELQKETEENSVLKIKLANSLLPSMYTGPQTKKNGSFYIKL